MAKPSKYWDDRAIRRLTDAEKQSEYHIKRIQRMYDRAYKNVQRDIENIYRNYSKATGLDVQSLKTLLTKTETEKLWDELRAKGLDKYIKENYKARITRLEKLQAQIYAKAKEIYPQEQLEQTMCYRGIINNSYYKTIYDTQMGTGFDFAFAKIDDNMVRALLNERWSGKNYSQIIWGNTNILAESLSEILGGAMLSGQSIAKTSKLVRDRFNVGKYYAERLVRTETNHFNNEADAMAYEEMDVDKYVFLATLDTRTSTICQNLDNKVFDLKDRKTGVNYPPMHPNCRSKTRAYMGEEIEATLKRRARNPITNKTEIIDNMSYKEWYDSKVKAYGKAEVDKAYKMAGRKPKRLDPKTYADQQQYERYKARLGEDKIGSFDKFKNIKYNNTTAYQEFVEYYRYKGNVPEATEQDFRTAKAIKETGIKGSVRVPPKPIDALTLTFNDEHASNHGCTLEDAISYVQTAKCSVGRKRWDGYHVGYYSKDGATYVADETHKIKTAFPKENFDPLTIKVMEVFK